MPFAQLEPGDKGYLPRTFQLQGDRYLLTPLSQRLGLKYIDGEHSHMEAGSHLFQACDMGYVRGQRERFARIRKALG